MSPRSALEVGLKLLGVFWIASGVASIPSVLTSAGMGGNSRELLMSWLAIGAGAALVYVVIGCILLLAAGRFARRLIPTELDPEPSHGLSTSSLQSVAFSILGAYFCLHRRVPGHPSRRQLCLAASQPGVCPSARRDEAGVVWCGGDGSSTGHRSGALLQGKKLVRSLASLATNGESSSCRRRARLTTRCRGRATRICGSLRSALSCWRAPELGIR